MPDHIGGTEIYVHSLCKDLQQFGIEVAVVKPSFHKDALRRFYEGVLILEYTEPSEAGPELQAGLVSPMGLSNFKALLLSEKPDAVHFHETSGSNGITIYHVKAAADLGFSVYTTFHLPGNICMRDHFLYKGRSLCNGIIKTHKCAVCILHKRGFRWGSAEFLASAGQLQKRIATTGFQKLFNYTLYVKKHKRNLEVVNENCCKVFVLSNWYKNLLVANGFSEEKIVVLSASSAGVAKSRRLVTKSSSSIVRFVYVGRITAIKGLHIALEAFRNLKKQNWQFDIYGPVTDEQYHQHCRKLSCKNQHIQWKGAIEHREIIKVLGNYDALIFPSLAQETMGLAMMEALAVNVPVIGSSIWTVEEKIKHGENGLIFRQGDAQQLSQQIEKVLSNPSLLYGLARNTGAVEQTISASHIVAEAYESMKEYHKK